MNIQPLVFCLLTAANALPPSPSQPFASFQRDAVESAPSNFRSVFGDFLLDSNEFGSRSLPLRAAIETVPDRFTSRQPLRDAIERRPPPDEPLNPEIDYDLPEYPGKFVENYVTSHRISSKYRIGNPYQQIIPTRIGRRLRIGNQNLRERPQIKSNTTQHSRLVCYLDGSAALRREPFNFHANNLDARTCTHVIYAFATIDPHQFTIKPRDFDYDVVRGGFRAVTGLKRLNPHLKVLISIGGVREEGSHKFSDLVTVATRRRDFIKSLIRFLDEYNFDGVDFHWQYPGAEEFGGRLTDKANLNLLLEEISEIFQLRGWLLSISVPASRFRAEDGYDAQTLTSTVDFINLQAYDLHVDKEPLADHHSPLTNRPQDDGLNFFYNVEYAVKYWLKRGIQKSQLQLGIALYGRSFRLSDGNQTAPGADIRGPGRPGFYTQTPGVLAYYELCDYISNEGWMTNFDSIGSPYAFNGDQWVGYENQQSLHKKVHYVKDIGLGGVSVWSVDLDDFQGLCGEKNPLLSAIHQTLYDDLQPSASCAPGDGLYSNPTDCTKYTVCQTGIAYNMKCRGHKMFDPERGRCDFINARNCQPGKTIHIPIENHQLNVMLEQQLKLQTEKGPKVVCYITNWAFYRKSEAKFVPEHLNTQLCTHVVYAFANLHPEQLVLQESDPWADIDNNLYSRVTSLADVPVLLGLGGWTDSTGDKYSRLISDGSARRRFISSSIAFLRRHDFKGLHLDWNYPVCWQSACSKGPSSDRDNFAKLIQELRVEFNKQKPPLLLAAAVSGYSEVITVAYDLPALSSNLDFMSVMTYDYHGYWERKTGHVSPLFGEIGDTYPQYNTNYTLELLVSRGAIREKLLVGVPFYGQSFTLSHNTNNDLGSSSKGPGEAGEFTKQPGMLAYYEICSKTRNQKWKVKQDNPSGPYAFQNSQWVSYDDPISIQKKAKYIVKRGFGGAVAWTVDLDDFSNNCCLGSFPLLRALNRGLGLLKDSPSSKEDCSKPPEPVTPPAPTLTTGVDSGAMEMTSTTWTSWSSIKPETTTPTTVKTTSTWWTTSSSTPTTIWWQKPSSQSTESTTTSPWWTTRKTTTTTTTSVSPTTAPSVPSVIAPAPGNGISEEGKSCISGTYIPDINNCNAYYRCILGELRRQYCASGLHWNPDKQLCDWPAEAKCQKTYKPTTTTNRPKTTTQSITTTQTTTTTSLPVTTTSCVNGQYYPHKQCNQFYVCVNGVLVSQICGPGLQWSVQQNSCDWSFRINCAAQQIKLENNSELCEAGSYSYLAGDCSQYKMCLWGKYETFSCANGLHWNNQNQICDWPDKAKCDKSISPPIGSNPQQTTTEHTSTLTTTTTTTTTEKPQPLSGYYKIVCYFTNWAWYRRGLGKYTPENIDPNLCTHIIYGFAVLDYENLIIKAHDSWADFDNKFYERVVAYKKLGLKVSLALGGWNDSSGDKYSRLVNNPAARARFIKHALEFLAKYEFDGLDLDWEYPKCWQVDCKKGPDSDKPAFAAFIREINEAFAPHGLLLSAAVSPSKTVVDAGYDVAALAKYLNWVAVMTYDFHGQWDKKTGHVAPLYYHPDDDVTFFNANFSINYWISEGVPSRNIVMGIPLYGQSFQLENASNNGLNAKAPGPGQAGEFTKAAGFLAYYEICDRIKNKGWTVVQDPEHRMGPYAYKGNQWVSFDDQEMVRRKVQFIRDLDLGGGMVWALDLDDFRNRCDQGVHPLMNVLREGLRTPGTGITTITTTTTKKPKIPTNITKKPMETTESITTLSISTSSPSSDTTTTSSNFKIVCYFTNWAWYRQGGGKYLPSDIDADLCTHIIYGFAVLDGDQLVIKPHDTWADFDNKFYEKVTAYKAKGIKVLVAIGGWNDSAGDKYSKLVNNPSARKRFIAHVVTFIQTNNFDGLDLDWEYPKCWQVDCNKGPNSDKLAFAEFVKELYEEFKPRGWLLSAAVSPAKKVVDAGYDVVALSKYLDWIAVMCYDYHGQWDKVTGHVAPMYPHPEDADVTFNANFSINYWISLGADRQKLVMGMPMYGQSFSLADNNVHGLNAPTYGGGEAGEATRARGFLSYYEICQNIKKKGWKVVRDSKGRIGPYAYLRDQWVSFDDIGMIKYKSEYIKAMGLGGGMIWALDLDDFKNYCGCEEYPLLKTINRVLRDYPSPQPSCPLELSLRDTPTSTATPTLSPTLSLPCKGEVYMPHPSNCQQYLLCLQGDFISQSCPAGLYWNREQKHCDWPENAACHPDALPKPEEPQKEIINQKPVLIPTKPPVTGNQYKVVCYFTNWAWYRPGDGKYKPEDIDSNLCTHIVYGFAVLDANSLTIKPHDSWADIDNEFYRKVTALKSKGIKVLIAIGGWNDSLGPKYSQLVNSIEARRKFVDHVVEFIEKWNFDGLDFDWEYPKCWQVDCSKGPDSDKSGFAALIQELSAKFTPRNWLLSAAVSPSKMVIDAGYDVPVLTKHLDWIAVMTYDFHGHWDKKTGHVAPLYYYPGDTYDYFNANFSLHYWLEKGASARKLVMGMPLYGQSFTLADNSVRSLNAKSYGPGEAGEFTRAGGFLAYYEICERVKRRSWVVTRDPEGRIGPYASHGNQWVSYDDVQEIRRKSNLIKELGLGGGMVWALDLDDFRNRCGCGKHPLLRVLNQELRNSNYNARINNCT